MTYKELNAYNLDIVTQIKMLEKIIILNENINTAIERAKTLSIENYYIGAGCRVHYANCMELSFQQTFKVWN